MAPGYARPLDLAEALELGARPGAVFLAGGTDLLVPGSPRPEAATLLVSLRDVEELQSLHRLEDGRLFIGAMNTHSGLASNADVREHFPALAEACLSVGSAPIRAAATVGGNLCTAAPSADSACPLLVHGADAVIGDGGGIRDIPLSEFFLGPRQTALEDGQLLLGVKVPASSVAASASAFRKISRRAAVDIALVGVAALVELDGEVCARLRVALSAVAPTPLLLEGTDELAVGRRLDAALLDECAAIARAAARPITDVRASAGYRLRMVEVLVRDVVARAWRRALERGEGSLGR